jgi:hypothetical protein
MEKKNKKRRYVQEFYFPGSSDTERQAFKDGVESVRSQPYLHAYYAGVGYGKAKKKKALGFKSHEEKQRFEAGMAEEEKHYISVDRVDKPWYEKLFGIFKKKPKRNTRSKRKASSKRSTKSRKVRRSSSLKR